jgi:hypothetical protein
MGLSRYSAWLGIGCGIMGLAISGIARAHTPVGKIKLQGALPEEQAELLHFDRAIFSSFRISEDNTQLKDLMKLNSTSSKTLINWLEARVQVVVTENFDEEKHMVPLQKGYAFENPGVFSVHERFTPPPVRNASGGGASGGSSSSNSTPAKMVVNMSNLGEYIYRLGKIRGVLLGLDIDGIGVIPVSSPRSGVIRVGAGLFDEAPRSIRTAAAAIPRLKTFFHEARHADGNGKSLGFPHAICPPGHNLHGNNACDRNLNGPYTVGGQVMRAMTESCTTCSRGQREALRLQYLESFGRVLPYETDQKTRSTTWDSTPEGKR